MIASIDLLIDRAVRPCRRIPTHNSNFRDLWKEEPEERASMHICTNDWCNANEPYRVQQYDVVPPPLKDDFSLPNPAPPPEVKNFL